MNWFTKLFNKEKQVEENNTCFEGITKFIHINYSYLSSYLKEDDVAQLVMELNSTHRNEYEDTVLFQKLISKLEARRPELVIPKNEWQVAMDKLINQMFEARVRSIVEEVLVEKGLDK